MNLTKKNIQKTSGIHRLGKFYKPGQLVTIDRYVYRITKTNELLTCEHCVNYKHWPSKCRYFGCWGHVPKVFNVAVGSPKPPKGNRITDGTQNSSIGEK